MNSSRGSLQEHDPHALGPPATLEAQQFHHPLPPLQHQALVPSSGPLVDDDDDEPVTDARRNWAPDVTLKLVQIWKRVCQERPDTGRVARMHIVYDRFCEAVDCASRSRKAVEDKLYTAKQMYHFIMKMNGNFKQGYRSTLPTWFELSKAERRAVRSLHRIRIPNISLQVFNELDSVLNPNVTGHSDELLSHHTYQEEAPMPSSPMTSHVRRSDIASESEAIGIDNGEVVDIKRNWSHDVTLQLAKVWGDAVRENSQLRGAMLSHCVYTEFMNVVGGSSRSRKAVEDKMHSMKEMYRFIRMHDATSAEEPGKKSWFELGKLQRRQQRAAHNIRAANLTHDVFVELDSFMNREPNAPGTPSAGYHEAASVEENDSTQMGPSNVAANNSEELGSSTAQYYAAIRRLAVEENGPSSAHTMTTNRAEVHDHYQHSVDINEQDNAPPAPKRLRQGSATPIPATASNDPGDQLLRQLLVLQEQAIVERRQQHVEQMEILGEIAGLLRRNASATQATNTSMLSRTG